MLNKLLVTWFFINCLAFVVTGSGSYVFFATVTLAAIWLRLENQKRGV